MRKTFAQAFDPYLQNTANMISRKILMDSEQQDGSEKLRQKQLEEQERIRKEQEANQTMQKLLSGGTMQKSLSIDPKTGGKDYFMPYTPQEKAKLMLGLTNEQINKYQDIQRSIDTQNDYVERDYSKPDGIYGFNKRTNKFEKIQEGNPIYKPKRTNTVTDYNSNGEKIIREFYEDGSTKDIPTGFFKKNESGESFDPKKLDKVLTGFTASDIKVNNLKAKYSDPFTANRDALKYEINSLNEANHSSLYNIMDDNTRAIVDQWFDQLKDVANKKGIDLGEFEKQNQEKLKEQFKRTVISNFNGSSEDYAKKRALILYSNFKYGYIY